MVLVMNVLKWGYFGELKLHNRTNLRLGGGYRFDIFESGGEQWIDEPNRTILAGRQHPHALDPAI
jgi:hypothetical protein